MFFLLLYIPLHRHHHLSIAAPPYQLSVCLLLTYPTLPSLCLVVAAIERDGYKEHMEGGVSIALARAINFSFLSSLYLALVISFIF
ncbi:hypothetical protein DFP73DRAFT_328947 [Morchella snyderi]|nr:hypothetical protein DFP73DRAFT_328947 [Morchella snyderi]